MTRRARAETIRLLQRLRDDAAARLVPSGDDAFVLEISGEGRSLSFPAALIRPLVASGLLSEAEPGRLAASAAASAWLKRQNEPRIPFRAQHDPIEAVQLNEPDSTVVLKNLAESPVAALARRVGRGNEPWLAAHAVAAAERFRRDFEIGQLQPRVTANWSASINTGRRAEGGAGLADLTDMALAARLRFDRAAQAVGPELSGVLIDICCFVKGLALVERERQWPARSAKLVLRLALERLARHYGLTAEATGRSGGDRTRHWGAEDYRPTIS